MSLDPAQDPDRFAKVTLGDEHINIIRGAGLIAPPTDPVCPHQHEADPGVAVRPLLQDRNQFNRLYQQRQPYYAAADLTVQTLEKSAAAAAQEIAEWLRNSHFLN